MGAKRCKLCEGKEPSQWSDKPGNGHICWSQHVREPALTVHAMTSECARDEEVRRIAMSVVASATTTSNDGIVVVHLGCAQPSEWPNDAFRAVMKEQVSSFMYGGKRCILLFED